MSDRAKRFFKIWVEINLDYEDNKELSFGSPPDMESRLQEDARREGISEDELSAALNGNIGAAIFDAMMTASSPDREHPTRGTLN